LLGAAVVLVAIALVLGSDVAGPPIVRGAPAPDFDLPRLGADGAGSGPRRLTLEELAGRVVLVNFWASWCEPCEREMPAMERLYAALPREQFELVAVAIDESEAEVQAFQDRYQLSFPIVLDLDKAVSATYQTMGVPESLLIDRDGQVVERYVGPREWDAPEYVGRIRALIAGSTGGPASVPSPGAL
jgi:thiol-disulfide isomerase/thioredoxin